MALPVLNVAEVSALLPDFSEIAHVSQGGQKVVFRGLRDGVRYALKFALIPPEVDADDPASAEIANRASREVEIMRACTSRYVVKLGPLGLGFATLYDQHLLYFSEEFIEGESLRSILDRAPLSVADVVQLGAHIGAAIDALWSLRKVHRDVKPGNIIVREDGDFVLLDAGLAFDVIGESISQGLVVGTIPYFSPEQFEYNNRRVLDFRSDLFALGVTMYEAVTGTHPFWRRGESSVSVFKRITTEHPAAPSSLRGDVPPVLDRIILRLLGKSPHLRYRTCDTFLAALERI